jgi:hypothetical protein
MLTANAYAVCSQACISLGEGGENLAERLVHARVLLVASVANASLRLCVCRDLAAGQGQGIRRMPNSLLGSAACASAALLKPFRCVDSARSAAAVADCEVCERVL